MNFLSKYFGKPHLPKTESVSLACKQINQTRNEKVRELDWKLK